MAHGCLRKREVGPSVGPWASLVAQTIKNPPAMWETWVRPLVWEDPLEEGMATHSSLLAWRIPWTEEPDPMCPWGHKESDLLPAQEVGPETQLSATGNPLPEGLLQAIPSSQHNLTMKGGRGLGSEEQ